MGKQVEKPSESLRRAIEEAVAEGVTLYRIAMDSDVDYATIWKFMNGERGISVETLDKLSAYLRLKLKR